MKKDEFLHFLFIPLVIGILGGISAIGFRWLIKIFEIAYQKITPFETYAWYLISMPVVFWISYVLITKFLINTSNVTLDHIAKKISLTAGNFSILKGFFVLFLTSLNIGFGAPVGREAPIAKLGGLLGELFLKIIHVPKVNLPIYLAAAVSSAIAATFNAPLAGIILGIEIIIGKVNTYIIIPMIVSCSTATMIAREFLGDYTAFFVPHLEFKNVYFYVVPLEGAVFAVLAVLMFYFFDVFRKMRAAFKKNWEKAVVLNGFLVGFMTFNVPQIAGVGYGYITELFQNGFGANQALMIMFIKFIAVILTLGSGLFGGLMSPSIFIGAFGGYFIGALFLQFGVDPKVMALVGSVAMLSGISRAPLRSSVIIIELTHSYQMLIPSLIVGSITSFIVAKFEPGSYFKRSLIQKGIDIENPKIIRFLKKVDFSKYFQHVPSVEEDLKIDKLGKIFKKNRTDYLPVVNSEGKLLAIVSLRDFRRHFFNRKTLKVKDIMNKKPIKLHSNSTLEEVVKTLGLLNTSSVPYVKEDGTYVDMIDLRKLFKDISLIDRYKII